MLQTVSMYVRIYIGFSQGLCEENFWTRKDKKIFYFDKLLEMLKASCCHTEPHRGFASPEHSQAGAEDLGRRKRCAIIHSWNHDP